MKWHELPMTEAVRIQEAARRYEQAMREPQPILVPSPPVLATTCPICGAHMTLGRHRVNCKNAHRPQAQTLQGDSLQDTKQSP